MDLTVVRYANYHALLIYMEGSAAVIGTLMPPILGPADPAPPASPRASWGSRSSSPTSSATSPRTWPATACTCRQDDLTRCGVTRADLAPGPPSAAVRALLAFEIDRARGHYRAAEDRIGLLAPSSQPAIRTALVLYGEILDQVERSGYAVLQGRVRVPNRRRLAVAARNLVAARAATLAERRVTVSTPG